MEDGLYMCVCVTIAYYKPNVAGLQNSAILYTMILVTQSVVTGKARTIASTGT